MVHLHHTHIILIFMAQDLVAGTLIVNSKEALSHQGIVLTMEGSVRCAPTPLARCLTDQSAAQRQERGPF
jgi:hypothetical protein